MKRSEFDHAIRAAGSILGESEILIVGSQAVHGSLTDDLPVEAQRSIEVDIVAFAMSLMWISIQAGALIPNGYAAYADMKIEIADVTAARSRALPVYVMGELKCK